MFKIRILLVCFTILPLTAFSQSPTLNDDDLSMSSLTSSPNQSVKIAFNQVDSSLYILTQGGSIYSVNLESGNKTEVQTSSNHSLTNVQGFDVSSEGEFYLVGNDRNQEDYTNTGVIKKGTKEDGEWQWVTVAETDPYPLSNTDFDHIMNELRIGPDERYLYVNSGSRTDHGEEQAVWGQGLPEEGLYPGTREVPLTSAIFRIPADSTNLMLKNDINYLIENDYLFADGTRNSFGLAFNGEGKLFSADNAGERDNPGEFNWLREGRHYGFPWRVGGNDTPMQYDDYDPDQDPLISTDSRDAIFYNDPDFPPKPDSLTLTEPILNHGPHADIYRDSASGDIFDAGEQDTAISSFTAHRSTLGLSFDNDSTFTGDYKGDGFALAFSGGRPNSPFLLRVMEEDPGVDLSHIELTQTDSSTYEMNTYLVAGGFYNPIDSEIVGDKLYVLEFKNSWLNTGADTKIWEINFSGEPTSIDTENEIAKHYELHQNYPNPFNPSTQISYRLPKASSVQLDVFNTFGRKVKTLIGDKQQQAGQHTVRFNAGSLASGVYYYRLKTTSGETDFVKTMKMTLLR